MPLLVVGCWSFPPDKTISPGGFWPGVPKQFQILRGNDHNWLIDAGRGVARVDRSIPGVPQHGFIAANDSIGENPLTAIVATYDDINPVASVKTAHAIKYVRRQQCRTAFAQHASGIRFDDDGSSHGSTNASFGNGWTTCHASLRFRPNAPRLFRSTLHPFVLSRSRRETAYAAVHPASLQSSLTVEPIAGAGGLHPGHESATSLSHRLPRVIG
jgi:hypothetical protein